MFASYSYSCKILQPCVAAKVRVHSDAVLSSTGALLMKSVIESNPLSLWPDVVAGSIYANQPLMISMRGQRQGAKFKGIITIRRVAGHF